jgi:hypothetical protein
MELEFSPVHRIATVCHVHAVGVWMGVLMDQVRRCHYSATQFVCWLSGAFPDQTGSAA